VARPAGAVSSLMRPNTEPLSVPSGLVTAFNPLRATGILFQVNEQGWLQGMLGSCFAFREPRAFLTAAHCVGDLGSEQLAIWMPGTGEIEMVREGEERGWTGIRPPLKPAADVTRHDRADVALLRASDEVEPTEPFWGSVGNMALGEEFQAFGYPENVLQEPKRMPTARLFTGHYQRFFPHQSHLGHEYLVGEMSIPSPPGLSGGPLFRPGAQQMVTGLAAENFDSATTLEASEVVSEERGTVRTEYQRVISYGLAVILDPLSEWLDAHIAPFDAASHAERQRQEVERRRMKGPSRSLRPRRTP
jgi:Trypsin-like peptidase domain